MFTLRIFGRKLSFKDPFGPAWARDIFVLPDTFFALLLQALFYFRTHTILIRHNIASSNCRSVCLRTSFRIYSVLSNWMLSNIDTTSMKTASDINSSFLTGLIYRSICLHLLSESSPWQTTLEQFIIHPWIAIAPRSDLAIAITGNGL